MVNLLQQQLTWANFAIFFAWGVVMLLVILGFVTYAIYFERKVIGWMQLRIGPEPDGAARFIAKRSRCHEAADQGGYDSTEGGEGAVHSRSGHYLYSVLCRLRSYPLYG